tara:strand:+ start:1203 stop:2846 length:1644 start_codon:yes stop_codon:yes gene_type:complete
MANKTAKGLTFIFGADMKGFERAMKKSQRNIKKFGTDMKRMGRSLTMNLTLPMAAFAAASVKAFDTQIKAETKLLTALKGKEDIQKRLIEQAKQLQTITLFGDEETIAAQAMLATMGLEEEAIRQLIPLVQDMAVAKGMNLVQAADLVAKSVGSSTNALSRYGIEITGAVGSTERLDSAVGALTKMFQGQAEAIAKEGLGPFEQLKNALGDVSEEFGKLILESVVPLKNELEKLVGFLTKLTDAQKQNIIKWGALAAALGPIILLLGNVVLLFSRLVGWMIKLIPLVTKLGKIVPHPITRLVSYALTLGSVIWGAVKGTKELNKEIKKLPTNDDPLLKNILEHGKLVPPEEDKKVATPEDRIPTIPKLGPIKMINEELEETITLLPEVDNLFKNLGNTFSGEINILAQEFSRMFEFSLSSAMMAQENFFDSFIANIKRAITQMIALHAAQFITNQLFGNLTGATTGANIFTTIFGFANGGLVSGPTLSMVGEGSGTSLSNPEVIAPLDKLKQYMGGGSQNITVTGRLVGNDIWLSNSKTNIQRQRAV